MTTQEQIELIRQACIASNPRKEWDKTTIHHNGEEYTDEEPIRLSDILLAINKSNIVFGARLENGSMKMMSFGEEFNFPKDSALWNLLNDDITLQSQPTIAFIHSVLYGLEK